MKIVTVKLPEKILEALDELVITGRFASRSEVIRAALSEFISKELWSEKAVT
jgi:Arc/MetJ-type ribon-helix-helix transcriptional regulator